MIPDFKLLDAVRRGCVSDIELALNEGAGIRCRDFTGLSVLEVAEKHHKNELVRPLIKHGADPDQESGKRGNRLQHNAVV